MRLKRRVSGLNAGFQGCIDTIRVEQKSLQGSGAGNDICYDFKLPALGTLRSWNLGYSVWTHRSGMRHTKGSHLMGFQPFLARERYSKGYRSALPEGCYADALRRCKGGPQIASKARLQDSKPHLQHTAGPVILACDRNVEVTNSYEALTLIVSRA